MYTLHELQLTDAVVAVALTGMFGLKFLMTATDGGSTHGLGLLYRASVRGRIIALIGANVLMGIPVLIAWIVKGFTPVDLWHGAQIWWFADQIGPLGKAVAILMFYILLSPLQSAFATMLIVRAHTREQREVASYHQCNTAQ